MKIIKGFKIGGLQQKIFNLMLIFIVALVGVFVAISIFQQKNLSGIVEQSNRDQQASIASVSEQTMEAVLETSLTRTTALQAYIADELFGDLRSDVQTLQTFATELFKHAESFAPHAFYPPDKANDGTPSVQVIHEPGVDPESSEQLALIAHMSEVMLAMYQTSDNISGIFVGTADGNLLFVNDRSGAYVADDGTVMTLDVRSRPWYTQAAETGELVFTGLESDAYTGISTLECAAPVYYNGELVAVVGADIFLTSISDYVNSASTQGGFLCVINQNGQVLFSPNQEGTFQAELSANAPDLRNSDNADLARFVTQALTEKTGLETITVDGKEYYMTGVPMPSVGWAVLSAVDKELTYQPTATMLSRYEEINSGALNTYTDGAKHSMQTFIIVTFVLILLALVGALVVAQRIVKPIEHMTRRIKSLKDGDTVFQMEKAYRTNDEIEVLAESFAELSGRTRDYIEKITEITAEKERIGTELALATRIQADMLPNIYPAFPERSEFDIYASMDPAKEVGGDFYDFFLIDETHLGLVIADVSGKGVPAALFMMIAKTLVQNNAMTGKGPAEVLRTVNNQICANNREEMFVTVWLGILDLTTGKLTAANAGHEYPALKQPDGGFQLYKDKHGFVIGGMEGVRYREYEVQLEPGSKLFVYTDGVPEATNAEQELFGTDRMLDALNANPDAAPQDILKNVRASVDGFVREAEQFDDLTMLCLEYKGSGAPKEQGGEGH